MLTGDDETGCVLVVLFSLVSMKLGLGKQGCRVAGGRRLVLLFRFGRFAATAPAAVATCILQAHEKGTGRSYKQATTTSTLGRAGTALLFQALQNVGILEASGRIRV